jgi:hypothetical protein
LVFAHSRFLLRLRLLLLQPLQHLAHAVVHLAKKKNKNKNKQEERGGSEDDCGVSALKEGEEKASMVVGTSMYFLTHRSAQRPSDTLSSDSPKRNTHFFQHWCCILQVEIMDLIYVRFF